MPRKSIFESIRERREQAREKLSSAFADVIVTVGKAGEQIEKAINTAGTEIEKGVARAENRAVRVGESIVAFTEQVGSKVESKLKQFDVKAAKQEATPEAKAEEAVAEAATPATAKKKTKAPKAEKAADKKSAKKAPKVKK